MEEGNNDKTVKTKPEEPRGLPHHQVPQPGDFSTEALEHIRSYQYIILPLRDHPSLRLVSYFPIS